MNQTEIKSFSPMALFCVILVTLLGFEFLDTPNAAAKTAGPSGYWTIVVALLLAVGFIFLIGAFRQRFPRENLLEAAAMVMGKPLALIGNLLYLIGFEAWVAFTIREGIDLLSVISLRSTPYALLVLLYMVPVGYLVLKGPVAVWRLAAVLLLPLTALRVLLECMMLQNVQTSYLLPLFSAPPGEYLKGGFWLSAAFVPLAAALLLHHRLSEPKRLRRILLAATGVATAVIVLEIVGSIGTLGASYLQRFNWPTLASMRTISFPYLILEQTGLLFLVVWGTMLFAAVSFYTSLVAEGVRQMFPSLGYAGIAVGILLAVLATVLAFPDSFSAETAFRLFRHYIAVPMAAYPLLVYLAAIFLGKKGAHF